MSGQEVKFYDTGRWLGENGPWRGALMDRMVETGVNEYLSEAFRIIDVLDPSIRAVVKELVAGAFERGMVTSHQWCLNLIKKHEESLR